MHYNGGSRVILTKSDCVMIRDYSTKIGCVWVDENIFLRTMLKLVLIFFISGEINHTVRYIKQNDQKRTHY